MASVFSNPWIWVWIVLAAALYIGEMLTFTFFLLPFAVGATVSIFACAFGAELWLQWVLFIVVSISALVVVRPLAKRLQRNAPTEKSGVDRLIGCDGVILEQTAPSGESRARVIREVWNVATEGDDVLQPGDKIMVLRVEGTKLIVQKQ